MCAYAVLREAHFLSRAVNGQWSAAWYAIPAAANKAMECGWHEPSVFRAWYTLMSAWVQFWSGVLVVFSLYLGWRRVRCRTHPAPRPGCVEPVERITTESSYWYCPTTLAGVVRAAVCLQERDAACLGRVRNIAAKWMEDTNAPADRREAYTLGALAAALVLTPEEVELARLRSPVRHQ